MPLSAAHRSDFIGSKFGMLTVLRKEGLTKTQHMLVRCLCECGNEKVIRWGSLRCGHTTSCGCIVKRRAGNLVGEIFNSLTVISRGGSTKLCRALWLCRCICGKEITVLGSSLRCANIISCGCVGRKLASERMRSVIDCWKLPIGEGALNQVIRGYKRNAAKRGLSWELDIEIVRSLFLSNCSYCGKEPAQIGGTQFNNGRLLYTGIDRVDSKLGYTVGNVVPCCHPCNWIKGRDTLADFLAHVSRIAHHRPEIYGTLTP